MKETGYTLIRSDRKTTAIRILSDGSVEVRAPRRLPAADIERFLEEKRDWVEKHRQAMLARIPKDLELRKILYKGCWKEIRPAAENCLRFDGEAFFAPVDWGEDTLKTALTELMKKLARRELPSMMEQISGEMGIRPERLTITSAKTKWGSCTNAKNISLSWRLMAAPVDTIRCVICHELCHMTEMNHGPAFWALLEKWYPDWQQHRETLSEVQAWLDAYYR